MARTALELTAEELLAIWELTALSNWVYITKDGSGNLVWIKYNLSASTAPTITDDSSEWYAVWSIWIDTTADKAYVCLDSTDTVAVWTETTQSGWGWGWWWAILSWVISWPQVVWTVMTVPVNQTISATTFRTSLWVLPSGATLIVNLYKNWVLEATCTHTAWDSASNWLYQQTDTSFVSGSYSPGDVLSVEVSQIGSSISGSDLTFNLT